MPSHPQPIDFFRMHHCMLKNLPGFEGHKKVYASWTAKAIVAKNMKLLERCSEEIKAALFIDYMLSPDIYENVSADKAKDWILINKKEQCKKWIEKMISFTRQAAGCDPCELRGKDRLNIYYEFAELLRGYLGEDPVYFMPADRSKGFGFNLKLHYKKSEKATLIRPTKRRSPNRSNDTHRPTDRHTQAPNRCDKSTQTD